MALVTTDWTIATNGDIRWTGDGAGSGTNVTVLEMHRFLQDRADDAVAVTATADLLDITDDTPSDRATDNIVTLINGYNIDDVAARHIYDGSITQGTGATETKYQGLVVVGAVEAGTQIQVVQDNQILVSYWGDIADIASNPDATNNILLRVMIKTREFGADIDGRRLRCLAREFGDTNAEFSVTMVDGNNTAALFTGPDLNNESAEVDVEDYDEHVNTEGYQLLGVSAAAASEPFYSQWTVDNAGTLPATPTINSLYEFGKWLQKRPTAADSATETGTDFTVDDATVTGQSQEFLARPIHDEILIEAKFFLKVGTGTPIGELVAELWLSDDVGSGLAEPTGSVLATSEAIPVNQINETYTQTEFVFNDNVTMTAGEWYFIVIRNVAADASNTVAVRGSVAGSHAGNRAQDASGTWTATAADDLDFAVFGTPIVHGNGGLFFRGITHDITYDVPTGTFDENNLLVWGTEVAYDTGDTASGTIGEYYKFSLSGAVGKLLAIDEVTGVAGNAIFAIEPSSGTVEDNDVVTRVDGTASDGMTVAVTVTDLAAVGGRGLILADDGTDQVYIQLLDGAAPVNNLPIWETTTAGVYDQSASSGDALVNVTITARTISPSFLGVSTGTALIGAYGIGVDPADLTSADKLTDLGNTLREPPNNVTFTISGLVSDEDYILVGPATSGALEPNQLTLNAALTTDNVATIVMNAAIPTDTPGETTGGTLRVFDDNGLARKLEYSGWASATFTITTTDGNEDFATVNAAATNDVFISYVDELVAGVSVGTTNFITGVRYRITTVGDTDFVAIGAASDTVGVVFTATGAGGGTTGVADTVDVSASFTSVFLSNRDLFVRVRDGGTAGDNIGIKTFETPATLTTAGGSATAIRTPDA